ncbi:GNAT family N-acetyltransferase [Ornithinimicrobium sp. Y1847]|uniref:GNAT family N-acetyltransferase n=1 Tax=unclassified Ornithinimicrobium TaxID=2615080 RepID=UPI003B6769CF
MHRLTSHRELLDLSGGDPWVRWALDPALPGEVWVHEDVALVQRHGPRPGFWVAPLPSGMPQPTERERLTSALIQLRDRLLPGMDVIAVSVPQEHAGPAHEVLDLGDGGEWDWMWTTSTPDPDPRESQLVVLDDTRDAEELQTFTAAHNPRVWTEIGSGRVVRWLGLRATSGELLAIGGSELTAAGVPHLAGIVTAVPQRGHGWGTLVSRGLTRWAIEEHGVSTLGMFSDNDVARRVYRALGYRTARAWHSRRLAS